MSTLDETLRVISQHAPALREAGVTRVRADGVEFELQPDIPEPVVAAPQPEPAAKSPLDDATTYGFAAGSSLPGFRNPNRGD